MRARVRPFTQLTCVRVVVAEFMKANINIKAIDRRAVGPALVPLYFNVQPDGVAERAHGEPDMSLHLWSDCTLREACDLLWGADKEGPAGVLRAAPALLVGLVYPSRTGTPVLKSLGSVLRLSKRMDDELSLAGAGFQPGDALAVNVISANEVPAEPPRPGPPTKSPQGDPRGGALGMRRPI